MMYEESTCFDPSSNLQEQLVQPKDDFSNTHIENCKTNQNFSMDEQSYPQNSIPQQDFNTVSAQLEMELQQQLNLEMEQCYNNNNNNNINGGDQTHVLIQETVHDSNWIEMSGFDGENHYNHIQNGHQNHQSFSTAPYPITPDLLSMFPLPMCSQSPLLPNSSINFSNSAHKSSTFLASLGLLGDLSSVGEGSSASNSVVYDPLLPLNLPPQPPLLRELFHSLPHESYAYGGGRNGSLFGGVDERDLNGGMYQESDGRNFDNGIFEFNAGEMDSLSKNRDGKDTKHSERHRRVLLNDKYYALRKLIPSPTKIDRASIVGDAIDYINELKRTVGELKILVEQKRCARERLKRPKTEEDAVIEGNDLKSDVDHPTNGSSLRSSWLHRKSKNSEVDVRIVDDEVTVKIIQQKRINGLLLVSRVLDELQLDLHHVAGGLIGDYYSFLFNSKICEGSIVYASAIANKLIEVVDKQYAPTCRL